MTKKDVRIVFIGTPEFAVASLAAILEAGYNVVGVITAPDRKSGRGLKLRPSPVKSFAEEHSIAVLQPTNLKNLDFIDDLKSLQADLQIVIAFRMLPEMVWNMPKMGTINLHASLLPDYRGAAPINWAIINGETETGVTTFKLQHEIDTGNLLKQKRVSISSEDNVGSLHDKLMQHGAQLMVETIDELVEERAEEIPQEVLPDHHHAPKIYKDDCEIDWKRKGRAIINLIRGLSPYPAARTRFQGKVLKVFKGEFVKISPSKKPGQIFSDGKTTLSYSCKDGEIQLLEVQLEGKTRMEIDEFLRGVTL